MKKISIIYCILSFFASSLAYSHSEKFVIQDSDVMEIPDSVISQLDTHELWIARNEIYARKGRKFSNDFLNSYFNNCDWYIPKISSENLYDSMLSDVERKNVENLYAEESRRKNQEKFPIKCEYNKEYYFDLDGDKKDDKLLLSYTEFDVKLSINDKFFILEGFESLNKTQFYITDIARTKPGLEIAILDFGPSSDYITHFYVYSEDVYCIGHIGGGQDFPFKQYMQRDGFDQDGMVKCVFRADVIETSYAYAYWIYDYEKKELRKRQDSMYLLTSIRSKELKESIYIYEKKELSSKKERLAPQTIYFLETDSDEWLKLKCQDNTMGYVHKTNGKLDGSDSFPPEIIEYLFICD